MTKKQKEQWDKACKEEEELKGYVPAELLMLPMILNWHKKGLIKIGQTKDDLIVITNK